MDQAGYQRDSQRPADPASEQLFLADLTAAPHACWSIT